MILDYTLAFSVSLSLFMLMSYHWFGVDDPVAAGKTKKNIKSRTQGQSKPQIHLENATFEDLNTIIKKMRAKQFTYDFRAYDYEDIERELIEITADCPTGLCRSKCITRRFCEACGICNVVRSVRVLLHQMSGKIPKHLQTPIGNLENHDDWYVHEPYTAHIRRTIESCPTNCPPELLRANKKNPRIRSYNSSSEAYMIHFPTAYRCPRRRNIDTICINTHYWLKEIDHIDFGDGIKGISAPKTTVCIHETNDILNAALNSDFSTIYVLNED